MARRLTLVAVTLAAVPALLAALTVDPHAVRELGDPATALPHLVLGDCVPYLAIAVSAAVMAVLWSRRRSSEAVRPRLSRPLVVAGAVAVAAASLMRPSIDDALLGADQHQVAYGRLQLGHGGPLAFRTPVEPMPLEYAGQLGTVLVEGCARVCQRTVRLYAHRLHGPDSADGGAAPVELVGGGIRHDLTEQFASLRPGHSRLLSAELDLGPQPTRVELRLASDSALPVTFFEARLRGDTAGLSIDSGGGNLAYEASVAGDARQLQGGSALVVEGQQVPGGYSVVVLSGLRWDRHDLRRLSRAGGVVELTLRAATTPAWSFKLVAPGSESGPVMLHQLQQVALGPDRVRYRYPLARIDWRGVPLRSVLGLALLHQGPPGPFRLLIERVEVLRPAELHSGYALMAVSSLTPGGSPRRALIAAGPPLERQRLAPYLPLVRLGAALLLLIGGVGIGPLGRLIWRWPATTCGALLAGPVVVLLLEHLLPVFIAPRPVHLSAALVALALGGGALARYRLAMPAAQAAPESEPVPAPAPAVVAPQTRFDELDALKTVAMVGIIGIHVTADPAGGLYGAYPPSERLVAAAGRALAAPFDIAIFIGASLFLLAHGLQRRSLAYGEQVARRLRRLLVPFAAWTLLFLLFRYAKAFAFGYGDAYRAELGQLSSWLGYALLGSAQYHLHFLPFLAGLTLLYPLFRPAGQRPAWALLLLATLLGWFYLDQAVHAWVTSPEPRAYVLRATKTLGYLGFGWLAFALCGAMSRGLSARARRRLLAGAAALAVGALAVLLQHARAEAAAGRWLPHDLWGHLARHLSMAAALLLFVLPGGLRWPRWLVALSPLTFGVYLIHPLFLDLLEILERDLTWSPAARIAVNLVVVVVVSFAAVALLARLPRARWLVGLEGRR